jgi:hypothetical protein
VELVPFGWCFSRVPVAVECQLVRVPNPDCSTQVGAALSLTLDAALAQGREPRRKWPHALAIIAIISAGSTVGRAQLRARAYPVDDFDHISLQVRRGCSAVADYNLLPVRNITSSTTTMSPAGDQPA